MARCELFHKSQRHRLDRAAELDPEGPGLERDLIGRWAAGPKRDDVVEDGAEEAGEDDDAGVTGEGRETDDCEAGDQDDARLGEEGVRARVRYMGHLAGLEGLEGDEGWG